ncbi:uncharacterized protein LOC127789888 isoform X3 [Diospyros lotus]|uniref:uncharacterized protein LOC127789888 isoform X3 n=1 Tax=Diospyros lotus TaxID=55363 RepID=UPI002256FF24|nr:uncharacterized protein LOC127789888 isoform X3 [Diospyros lotus]
MLQYPAFMRQYPWSTGMIPTSFLLPAQWPQPHNDDLLLAMEESDFEDKCSEIRKTNNNIIVIGKTTVDNDKEDYDNDVDDEEADNAEESEVGGRENGEVSLLTPSWLMLNDFRNSVSVSAH